MNIGIGTGYNNPVTNGYGPGVYGTFGGYYNAGNSLYSTQGYYEMDKVYFVQSNMYDAKTAKLVWSAQSETFNPSTLESTSKDFAVVMVAALKKSGLIYREEKAK